MLCHGTMILVNKRIMSVCNFHPYCYSLFLFLCLISYTTQAHILGPRPTSAPEASIFIGPCETFETTIQASPTYVVQQHSIEPDESMSMSPEASETPYEPSEDPLQSVEPFETTLATQTVSPPLLPPRRVHPPSACDCLLSGRNCNESTANLSVVCEPYLPPQRQSFDCHWYCCLLCIFNPEWSPCIQQPLQPICDRVIYQSPPPNFDQRILYYRRS